MKKYRELAEHPMLPISIMQWWQVTATPAKVAEHIRSYN